MCKKQVYFRVVPQKEVPSHENFGFGFSIDSLRLWWFAYGQRHASK